MSQVMIRKRPPARSGAAVRRGGVSILALIRHSGRALPPTARRIATFIDKHAEDVIRMSITELAEQTHSSEVSVVGLCQRLGI